MSDIRENKQKLNYLMQKIGNTILPVLDESWEKVVVGYFIEDSGVTHLQLFVLNTDEDDYSDLIKLSWDIDRYDSAIIDLEDLCEELHTLCEEVKIPGHRLAMSSREMAHIMPTMDMKL